MIDVTHAIPISKQAAVLCISGGTAYYRPRPAPAIDLELIRRIDELHMNHPFAGSRMLRDFLTREGFDVGRLHVATLMKRMGITLPFETCSCRPPRVTRYSNSIAIEAQR